MTEDLENRVKNLENETTTKTEIPFILEGIALLSALAFLQSLDGTNHFITYASGGIFAFVALLMVILLIVGKKK